jgi:glycosyltransferase involved in cell wall biosynthesis
MKIALLASTDVPHRSGVGRHVEQLAERLTRRGAEVEILTQGTLRDSRRASESRRVRVHRYPTMIGAVRFAVAPGLRERLHAIADSFDVADVHSAQGLFAMAAAHAGFRRLVFTPHAPIERLLGWPHGWATRAAVAGSTQIVCSSMFERDRLCARYPAASGRTRIVPIGVDLEAIAASRPFPSDEVIILSAERLERPNRVGRAIAAMASLSPAFRLVIAGDGPDRHRLQAYAADLQVASRVTFVGALAEAELYRWMRTASIVLALPEEHGSGSQLSHGIAAGACVVASDIPVHRELAARLADDRIVLVPAVGSPLEVAAAITDGARQHDRSRDVRLNGEFPSWDSVIDSTWALYERLMLDEDRSGRDRAAGAANGHTVQLRAGAQAIEDLTVAD